MRLLAAALIASLAVPAAAAAHDGESHATADEPARHESVDGPVEPLPFRIGGAFALTDQNGETRTQADPDGRCQLLFFGYANCPGICTAALPRMAEIADLVAAEGIEVTPVLVTVDPARDTPEAMRAALPRWGPRMVGLTGDEAALAHARALFGVERKPLFEDPERGPIYAHGAQIFLLSPAGEALTILPPIVSVERAARIVAKYARAM